MPKETLQPCLPYLDPRSAVHPPSSFLTLTLLTRTPALPTFSPTKLRSNRGRRERWVLIVLYYQSLLSTNYLQDCHLRVSRAPHLLRRPGLTQRHARTPSQPEFRFVAPQSQPASKEQEMEAPQDTRPARDRGAGEAHPPAVWTLHLARASDSDLSPPRGSPWTWEKEAAPPPPILPHVYRMRGFLGTPG